MSSLFPLVTGAGAKRVDNAGKGNKETGATIDSGAKKADDAVRTLPTLLMNSEEDTETVARILQQEHAKAPRDNQCGHTRPHSQGAKAKCARTKPYVFDGIAGKALVVFVQDISKSMRGAKHEQACEAVQTEIEERPANRRYLVVTFNHDVFCSTWIPMDSDAVRKELGNVAARTPSGATALFMAINYAATLVNHVFETYPGEYDPKLTVIKILTDGEDTCSMPELRYAARESVGLCRDKGVLVVLLQAGNEASAADAVGIPEQCRLHWKDDGSHLTSALSAASVATTRYLDDMHASSSHEGAGLPTFGFTDEQRTLSGVFGN